MEIAVTAAIVTYNGIGVAKNACDSIIKNTVKHKPRVLVIDNNSSESLDPIKNTEGAELMELGENIGFGAAHNKILGAGIGKYHFVVNPDITVSDDVLSGMVDFMEENPDVSMLIPTVLNSDGSVQYLPKEIPTFKNIFLGRIFSSVRDEYVWKDKKIDAVTDVGFCTGCFFCIRGEVFEAMGGFDERYFMYLEDADLTLRAKKFGRTVIAPQFSVTHRWERASSKKIKFLLIHTVSALKFLLKKRKLL